MVTIHSTTTAKDKKIGKGVTIHYAIHPTPFGDCLLAVTARGVCWLSFLSPTGRRQAVVELKQRWPQALFQERPEITRPVAERIFSSSRRRDGAIDLFVQGTDFQMKVWKALLAIPSGSVASYEAVAKRVGAPRAARAVGSAVANNPVSYLIPCHRVIRKSGALGNYGGGVARKQALLAWEAARQP
jgi:AraC family transcriptional regulator of adaptative response/methylated-DNA-[protein]-cysteine methyltransferase